MSLAEQGFTLIPDFISAANYSAILAELQQLPLGDDAAGIRRIDKKIASIPAYLSCAEFSAQTQDLLPPGAQLVRAILFNKSPSANWSVSWHQDKTVALSRSFADPAWRAWSVKDDVLHAQPPQKLLEQMLTIRVHLDAASGDNGCLKVIPGSHRLGVLSHHQIQAAVAASSAVWCEAAPRTAMVMRPLLIHASSKSTAPAPRRVLHLEFSDWVLPAGVHWG